MHWRYIARPFKKSIDSTDEGGTSSVVGELKEANCQLTLSEPKLHLEQLDIGSGSNVPFGDHDHDADQPLAASIRSDADGVQASHSCRSAIVNNCHRKRMKIVLPGAFARVNVKGRRSLRRIDFPSLMVAHERFESAAMPMRGSLLMVSAIESRVGFAASIAP